MNLFESFLKFGEKLSSGIANKFSPVVDESPITEPQPVQDSVSETSFPSNIPEYSVKSGFGSIDFDQLKENYRPDYKKTFFRPKEGLSCVKFLWNPNHIKDLFVRRDQHYVDFARGKNFQCTGRHCPICKLYRDRKRKEFKPTPRFYAYVYSLDEQEIKLLTIGQVLRKRIEELGRKHNLTSTGMVVQINRSTEMYPDYRVHVKNLFNLKIPEFEPQNINKILDQFSPTATELAKEGFC